MRFMNLKVPPEMCRKMEKFLHEKYAGHVWEWIGYGGYNCDEVLERAKEIANKPRRYKRATYTTFDLDFDQWDYKDSLDYNEDSWKWSDGVRLTLSFSNTMDFNGRWKSFDKAIKIDNPGLTSSPPQTLERFERNLYRLSRVLRHELGHMVQDLFQDFSDLEYSVGGLPSPDLQEMYEGNYDGHVYVVEGGGFQESYRLEHALRDVEFLPRLDDEIDSFVRKLIDKLNDSDTKRKAVRIWVGLEKSNLFPDKKTDFRSDDWKEVLNSGVRGCRFFKRLKKKQPEKWKEAVKKFVKGLHERGFFK